jgi:hypothetical protein
MTSKDTPPGAEGLGIWGNLGVWIVFGSAFGLLVGVLFNNVALGVPLGLSLGPALGLLLWLVFIAPRRNSHDES